MFSENTSQKNFLKFIEKRWCWSIFFAKDAGLQSETVTAGVLKEKVFVEISQNSQENTWARVSFLIKLQVWGQETSDLVKFTEENHNEKLHLLCSENTSGRLLLYN